jgi:repressor of nif and glnA expression
LAEAPPLAPKISDMELLSIICQLGRAATETSIRHAINERIGRQMSVEWVRDRIAEIEDAGLAVSHQHVRGAPSVRLTALGVERLSGAQHLPP